MDGIALTIFSITSCFFLCVVWYRVGLQKGASQANREAAKVYEASLKAERGRYNRLHEDYFNLHRTYMAAQYDQNAEYVRQSQKRARDRADAEELIRKHRAQEEARARSTRAKNNDSYDRYEFRSRTYSSTGTKAPTGWRAVFGFHAYAHPSKDELKKAFAKKAMTAHPDRGGSNALMSAINAAHDAAKKELNYV